MTSRLRLLLAFACPLVLAAAPPWIEEKPEPIARDSFDGKLRLGWKVVRPDEKHWSLTKNKGKLTIISQKGTIHKAHNPNFAKCPNLFVIGNPYGRSADFEVSVCVSDFVPTALYHQGGLLLYDDDDNYLKFVWECKGGKGDTHLVLLREVAAESELIRVPTPENKGKVWLRLTRRRGEYEYASSTDGKEWTVHGEAAWGTKGPANVGVIASNGPTDVPEIDVCFSAFRVRPLPRAKRP